VLGDVRYAIVPNELQSLWGIALDPAAPDEHADFLRLGGARSERLEVFWTMLRGKDLPGGEAVIEEND
jgi:hypothetical protein